MHFMELWYCNLFEGHSYRYGSIQKEIVGSPIPRLGRYAKIFFAEFTYDL